MATCALQNFQFYLSLRSKKNVEDYYDVSSPCWA